VTLTDSDKPADTEPGYLDQNWKGMSGAAAWHLIERHAEGWEQVGDMMHAWLEANK
jgi:hypothetical protein